MKTDIEIASAAAIKPITEVAEKLKIGRDRLRLYGDYMAKVQAAEGEAKLILVTAINPTAAGEGKTTVSVGLADGLSRLGKSVCLALREPSLGPVFGIKGGAAGGGYSQVAPMDEINLHFTGDLHAITAANNLLAAMVDNHMYWGNEKRIKKVLWRRCMDCNDRALRNTVCGLGYGAREDGFDITAASEVMAIFCLARDLDDLKKRLGDIVIGESFEGERVYARDINAHEAMTILLKDAINPNLVQTLEGVPAFVHGGPFANIAHGCNSIIATRTAMHYADYVVTEAGFGADLGAEKFLDVKCRTAGLSPDCVVIVATVRALKCAGGKKGDYALQDDEALFKGFENLQKHIENITGVFNLPCVVAINRFAADTDDEIESVRRACEKLGVRSVCSTAHGEGGKGAERLAEAVAQVCAGPKKPLRFAYELTDTLREKIEKVACKIYGADGVIFAPKAAEALQKLESSGAGKLPVVIAKTQYSLSDNAALVGRPRGFKITVRDLALRGGAGFIVAFAGEILLMPGLSRVPSAEKMSIDNGKITGLF